MNAARITTELGTERRCTRCGDWWPEDADFFPARADRRGAFLSWCRACTYERRTHYDHRRRTAS